ncbi:ribose 5-phosphate isomerase B [Candidatus Woesearchaeota archaeon]|nr:ribose 5-phosphate isomerase B [Candidatus Woesearchaeota archaeon]
MIYLGSDHAGFELKEKIKIFLKGMNAKAEDVGTFSEASVDYPDYAQKVAKKVVKDKDSKGILICGTGIGMCIAANKVKGVRAALCYDHYTAEMARKHNNANVLCMGGRTTTQAQAKELVETFLNTAFEGGRHTRRVAKFE